MSPSFKSPGKKAGIKEVAEAAGVSRAAVSLVLNGGNIRIGDEKRQRIIDVARQMNYTPHIGARRLAMRRMETLGLVLPLQSDGLTEYDMYEFTHHAALTANESGYDILLHFYDVAEAVTPPQTAGRVDGSIVLLGHTRGRELAEAWSITSQPHVFIGGGFFAEKPQNFVDVDLAAGMSAATNHLIRLGHQHIAYMSSLQDSEKLNGYLIALTRSRIPIHKEWIIETGFTEAALNKAAQNLLKMNPRPTGLVFTSDAVAIRMMRLFRDLGVRIPDELSITGYDNIESSSFITPGLTSVRVPTRQMANLTVNQLIAMVEKKPTRPLQTMLSAELVIRESSAAAR